MHVEKMPLHDLVFETDQIQEKTLLFPSKFSSMSSIDFLKGSLGIAERAGR
jgi:hypothetical protein